MTFQRRRRRQGTWKLTLILQSWSRIFLNYVNFVRKTTFTCVEYTLDVRTKAICAHQEKRMIDEIDDVLFQTWSETLNGHDPVNTSCESVVLVITTRGTFSISRKLTISDESNIRIRNSRFFYVFTCFLDEIEEILSREALFLRIIVILQIKPLFLRIALRVSSDRSFSKINASTPKKHPV